MEGKDPRSFELLTVMQDKIDFRSQDMLSLNKNPEITLDLQ